MVVYWYKITSLLSGKVIAQNWIEAKNKEELMNFIKSKLEELEPREIHLKIPVIKGTEKQISYAHYLIMELNKKYGIFTRAIEKYEREFEEKGYDEEKKGRIRKKKFFQNLLKQKREIEKTLKKIENMDNAGEIISEIKNQGH